MWTLEYTKRFLKELAAMPAEVRVRIEPIIFQELESENPFELGYLEKMKGYPNKYKVRVGDYRIGITVEKQAKILVCERLAHRRDIYRVFPWVVQLDDLLGCEGRSQLAWVVMVAITRYAE